MRLIKLALAGVFAIGLAAAAQAKVLYKEDFSNWRDETTNPGFKATISVDKETNVATIATDAENTFGKVMSPENPISMDITEQTTITYTLNEDIQRGDLKLNLMTAGEPYDSHEVITAQARKGTFKAKIADKVPWTGSKQFWVEIWLEGTDRKAKISNVKITDGEDEAAAPEKKATSKKKSSKNKK